MVVISQGIAHSNVIAAWHLYLVIGGYIALLAGHRQLAGGLVLSHRFFALWVCGRLFDISLSFGGCSCEGHLVDFWGLLCGRFTGRFLGPMSPTFVFNFWADPIAFMDGPYPLGTYACNVPVLLPAQGQTISHVYQA